MIIGLAQARPEIGNISGNLDNHVRLLKLAQSKGAALVVFPELSLSGYEPSLANSMALSTDDTRLGTLQQLSETHGVSLAVGAPIRVTSGVRIGLLLFQPNRPLEAYFKNYLHADEEPYFVSGPNLPPVSLGQEHLALAICYELSVPQHAESAHHAGATLYLASAVKTIPGVEKSIHRLREIAIRYAMMPLLVNSVGFEDGQQSGGKTSAWNRLGDLIGQLDGHRQGILLVDTFRASASGHYL
jgi:predicted amidohydrolase